MEDRQSFIANARREQIIKAAIEVLKEIGYVKTSLAKIAQKAKISTGLISYHFSGKEDLMNNTLMYYSSDRSEEHTSELQSRFDLVCRLLLEKKKKTKQIKYNILINKKIYE